MQDYKLVVRTVGSELELEQATSYLRDFYFESGYSILSVDFLGRIKDANTQEESLQFAYHLVKEVNEKPAKVTSNKEKVS